MKDINKKKNHCPICIFHIYLPRIWFFLGLYSVSEIVFTWARATQMKNPNSLKDPIFDNDSVISSISSIQASVIQRVLWILLRHQSYTSYSTWQPIRNQGHPSRQCPGVYNASRDDRKRDTQRVERKDIESKHKNTA